MKLADQFVSAADLAGVIGLDRSLIQKLHGTVFHPIERKGGKTRVFYRLGISVQAFHDYQVGLERKNSPLAAEMDNERLLKLRAERETKQMLTRAMTGDLHRAEDVKAIITDRNTRFRSRLLAIPSRLARTLIGQRDMPTIFRLLTEAVEEVLRELADYRAADFTCRNPQYLEVFSVNENGDAES